MRGQEFRQVFEPPGEQDRQVASVDHSGSELAGLLDQPAEVRIHLGRSARDIHEGYPTPLDRIEAIPHGSPGHGFAAIRTCINVAVAASLIAELPDIDLKNLDALRREGRLFMSGEHLLKRQAMREEFALIRRRRERMIAKSQGPRRGHETCSGRAAIGSVYQGL